MTFYLTNGIFHRKSYPPDPTPQSISFQISDDAAEIAVPAGTTSIWRCAFSDCRNVEKISIPDSVSYIGLSAFSACESLKEISIPHNISAIGSRAFYGCRSLKSITLPSSISTVAEYTFCGLLEAISIPASVKSIGRHVFHKCQNLRSITLAAHHLREPELQETLQSIRIIRCIAPIDDIPDEWQYKAYLGFAENEAAYPQKTAQWIFFLSAYSCCRAVSGCTRSSAASAHTVP